MKSYYSINNRFMSQYNVKGRYKDRQLQFHYSELVCDSSDRNFIKDLVRAKYSAVDVLVNIVNQYY